MARSRLQSAVLSLTLLAAFCAGALGVEAKRPALVIIDMQEDFITRGGNENKGDNPKKVEKLIAAQLDAISRAKAAGMPIVLIEYRGYGKTNSKIKAATRDYPKCKTFKKTRDGMFEYGNSHKKDLVKHLQKNEINHLIITGANGGACVKSSIEGALIERYTVAGYEGGIADFNYEEFMYPFVYEDYYKKLFSTLERNGATFFSSMDLDRIMADATSVSRSPTDVKPAPSENDKGDPKVNNRAKKPDSLDELPMKSAPPAESMPSMSTGQGR